MSQPTPPRCVLPRWLIHLVLSVVALLALATTAKADVIGSAAPAGNEGTFHSGSRADAHDALLDQATGTATAAFDFEVPPGRGGLQPNLRLSYAHTRGQDIAGQGWALSLPAIELRGLGGSPPDYDSASHYELSGEPLVQICPEVPCLAQMVVPSWAIGWALYRPRVERRPTPVYAAPPTVAGGYDRSTFRVVNADGGFLEFGIPRPANADQQALDVDAASRHIYRWNLVRQYDASMTNAIAYVWRHSSIDRGRLEEIYYTPKGTDVHTIEDYAHHIHLAYETWQGGLHVNQPMAHRRHDARLTRVAIASRGTDPTQPRERVRTYSLTYHSAQFELWARPFLHSITAHGRCATTIREVPQGEAYGIYQLPAGDDGCAAFPPTTYEYTSEFRFNDDGTIQGNLLPRELRLPSDCVSGTFGYKLYAPYTALEDVNRDGLPDVIQFSESGNAVYLNTQGSYLRSETRLQCAKLNFDGAQTPSAPRQFGPSGGITVPGYWGENYWLSYLLRLGPPLSEFDGYPTTLRSIRPVGDGSGVPTYSVQVDSPLVPRGLAPHLLGDLNGDRLIDSIGWWQRQNPNGTITSGDQVLFSKRDGASHVQEFARSAATNLYIGRDGGPFDIAPKFAALADMDGDGLLDYVTTHDPTARWGRFVYIPGRGDGNFGCESPRDWRDCVPSTKSPGYDPPSETHLKEVSLDTDIRGDLTVPELDHMEGLRDNTTFHFHDVNGDGRADLIAFSWGDNVLYLRIFLNIDGKALRGKAIVLPHGAESGGYWPVFTRVFFADVNGNGIDDIVLAGNIKATDRPVLLYFDLEAFPRLDSPAPGLLKRINHSGGATTEYTYATVSEIEHRSAISSVHWPAESGDSATGPWKYHSPVPLVVVDTITTRANAPAPYDAVSRTEYDYRDPVYDTWRGKFRGFRRTRSQFSGSGDAVDTKYYFGGCLAEDGWTRESRAATCPNAEADRDAAFQGLPIQIERLDAIKYHSTTRLTYNAYDLIGSGGAVSNFVYLKEANTYLYDTSEFVYSPQMVPVTVATRSKDCDSPTASVECQFEAVPDMANLRAAAVRVRRRQLFDSRKETLSEVWDDGQVNLLPFDSPAAIDRPIVQRFQPKPIAGIGIYLPERYTIQYGPGGTTLPILDGGWADGPVREFYYSYDAGRLKTVSATVKGTLPLQRRHSGGAATAPAPLQAVAEGTFYTLTEISYDVYGNVEFIKGPNGQCEGVKYAPAYFDHPVSTSSYLTSGTPCTTARVGASFSFDRGLGKATRVTENVSAVSRYEYDAHGRLSRIFEPSAYFAGQSELRTNIEYELDLSGPIHRTKVTRIGTDWVLGNVSDDVAWFYSNSIGQQIVALHQADTSAGDAAPWIASPGPRLDSSGRPVESFRPWFYAGAPDAFPVGYIGGATALHAMYDFGRLRTLYRPSDGASWRRDYHPLSVESWDPEGLTPGGAHEGASNTVVRDGHGRVTRTSTNGSAPTNSRFEYLATGEVVALERRSATPSSGPQIYRRWRRFDSLGRMVENVEPNASEAFSANPLAVGNMRAWRYAYDASGRMVGTSDPRGCGKNVTYDYRGRVLSEDYSPCEGHHPAYTAPASNGDGTEAFFTYDLALSSDQIITFASYGKLTSVRDRGAWTIFGYDGHARVFSTTRRIAKPGTAASTLASRYTAHSYNSGAAWDALGRLSYLGTGADAPELVDSEGSGLQFRYSGRGLLTRVDGTYGNLIADARADADGFPLRTVFGDAASTAAESAPNSERRVQAYRLSRRTGPWASGGGYSWPVDSKTTQAELVNLEYRYDKAGNIRSIIDGKASGEWPVGAKPTSRSISYDSLYRVLGVTSNHGNDNFVSPFAPEVSSGDTAPLPHRNYATRATSHSYSYDAFGNVLGAPQAPSNEFFDRSLTNVVVGTSRPNQLDMAGFGGSPDGAIAYYDAAGNMIALDVDRTSALGCLGSSGKCSHRFLFDWNEVNQLVRVRRWDYSALGANMYPVAPIGSPEIDIRFAYSMGERVLKSSIDTSGVAANDRHDVDVFPSLRLKQTTYASNDYASTAAVQQVKLLGLGTVVYDPSLPSIGSPRHVLMEFGDHIGSTSVVIDKATSELVEYRDYQPYGATDFDYRPTRWRASRSDTHFTGKELDAETGLIYFGARYYSPHLHRFISADPLAIHGWGADPNPYAYVAGRVYNEVDPFGLNCLGREDCGPHGDGFGGQFSLGDVGEFFEGVGGAFGDAARAVGDFFGGLFGGGSARPAGPPPPPRSAAYAAGVQVGADHIESLKGQWNGIAGVFGPSLLGPAYLPFATHVTDAISFKCETWTCRGSSLVTAVTIAAVTGGGGGGQGVRSGGVVAAEAIATEGAGGAIEFAADLSHVSGRTAAVRNAWIQETMARDLPGVRFTHTPQYNPFIKQGFGVAQEGVGTQIGPKAFGSQGQLTETLVHEELHHRWWSRGIYDHHANPVLDTRFESIVQRYMRMRGL